MGKRIGTQRGLSRIEAIAGVVVLVVVVASLFMLKGKFSFDASDSDAGVESSSDTTPDAADPTTTSASQAQLYFGAGSAKMPIGAEDTLAPLVKALRADAMLEAVVTADAAGSAALARTRAGAVRHAFEADGVSAARVVVGTDASAIQPKAVAAASDAVRVELRAR